MCIVCNAGDDGLEFVEKFAHASKTMSQATAAMLRCATVHGGISVEQQRRYGEIHREMVKMVRAWNDIEHRREIPGKLTIGRP